MVMFLLAPLNWSTNTREGRGYWSALEEGYRSSAWGTFPVLPHGQEVVDLTDRTSQPDVACADVFRISRHRRAHVHEAMFLDMMIKFRSRRSFPACCHSRGAYG